MAWKSTLTAPDNIVIKTKIAYSGESIVRNLKRKGHVWWTADGSMYVYYTPTHWDYL